MGLAVAQKLAAHGMNLCLLYRARKSDAKKIEVTFNELAKKQSVRVMHFNADVVKEKTREKVLAKIKEEMTGGGTIKTVVHSIAKGNLKPMVSETGRELQNDDFHITVDNMAISLYDWTKAVFDKNLFSDDARIISFTSEGNTKAWKNYGAVSVAKAALEAITRNIALEFAPFGIRANCVQAGMTDTASFRMIPGHKELKEYALERNPSGRMTTPEDVADAVYLLLKDESKWITGTTITVDGGEHLS